MQTTIITKSYFRNGTSTVEAREYSASEFKECFTREEIQALASGIVVEREYNPKDWEVKTTYVLADVAAEKAGL